jgi:hypothetical protein
MPADGMCAALQKNWNLGTVQLAARSKPSQVLGKYKVYLTPGTLQGRRSSAPPGLRTQSKC